MFQYTFENTNRCFIVYNSVFAANIGKIFFSYTLTSVFCFPALFTYRKSSSKPPRGLIYFRCLRGGVAYQRVGLNAGRCSLPGYNRISCTVFTQKLFAFYFFFSIRGGLLIRGGLNRGFTIFERRYLSYLSGWGGEGKCTSRIQYFNLACSGKQQLARTDV